MQEFRAILIARRFNELSSRLAELENLRRQVEEAERRTGAIPSSQSSPSSGAPSPLTRNFP
jgi:hypothetical protein